ncbi:MAG: hypothetical protein HY279_04850 [Nitrospinae bacterium]|nr:hypothetical protein [Nitrospinota bacterium]
MDTFNIIAGAASIVSLIISIFAINKAYKIEKNINISVDKSVEKNQSQNKIKQSMKGNNNIQSGRDTHVV